MSAPDLRELQRMIEAALALADRLELWAIGVSLDRARHDLIALDPTHKVDACAGQLEIDYPELFPPDNLFG